MNIHKNAPSIKITILSCILINILCFLIGKDYFYQLYSFSVIAVAIFFSTIYILKKDYGSLILVFIMLCITETIFRSQNNIPYMFSFYFIILICLPLILFSKKIISTNHKSLYLLNLLAVILLVSLNAYGNFDNYFTNIKKLGIPVIALCAVNSLTFFKKIKIKFDNIYKYFLFFSLPMMLNVNFFGSLYVEPDGSSRIWPPWGDGTGPVAGLASLTIIICVYFIFKRKYILYPCVVYINASIN